MANDADLALVIQEHKEELKEAIPASYWPVSGRSGC